mmetsp:Transcript_24936/g.46139  ORF Transcript_24936/g.46139 Transcript_24936/m.46139 type:complete len:301 (-) Transcript_24936:104-1006(-)
MSTASATGTQKTLPSVWAESFRSALCLISSSAVTSVPGTACAPGTIGWGGSGLGCLSSGTWAEISDPLGLECTVATPMPESSKSASGEATSATRVAINLRCLSLAFSSKILGLLSLGPATDPVMAWDPAVVCGPSILRSLIRVFSSMTVEAFSFPLRCPSELWEVLLSPSSSCSLAQILSLNRGATVFFPMFFHGTPFSFEHFSTLSPSPACTLVPIFSLNRCLAALFPGFLHGTSVLLSHVEAQDEEASLPTASAAEAAEMAPGGRRSLGRITSGTAPLPLSFLSLWTTAPLAGSFLSF